MLAPVVHILPRTRIRRYRLLPVTGRVLVRKGQKVNPLDVVAEANLHPHHVLLDVASSLGVPKGEADKYLERGAGDIVSEGDVLAGPVGWNKRVLRAPCSGRLIISGDGKILLEEEKPPFQIHAGLPGVVASLIPGRGAVIESIGSLAQGVWGNGVIGFGLLHVLITKPGDILTLDKIDIDLRGKVILAGFCGEEQILRALSELTVQGLVLSGMDASLIPLAEEQAFPVVIIDGFGFLPMNSSAYTLLRTSNEREITVNAEKRDIYTNNRPEVLINLPDDPVVREPRDATMFYPGQRVRIVRAPHQAEIGTLIAIKTGLDVLQNGIKAKTAEIELENGNKIKLPLANLEVLE
jgi:hypothetical protein